MHTSSKAAIALISLMLIVSISVTGWRFYVENDYDFIVEAACDPDAETCFYRDCSTEGDCPPNGLETYKAHVVNARDFDSCADNSCALECESASIACEPIPCGESADDTCLVPPEGPERSSPPE